MSSTYSILVNECLWKYFVQSQYKSMSTYLKTVFPRVLKSVLFKEKIRQSVPMFNVTGSLSVFNYLI